MFYESFGLSLPSTQTEVFHAKNITLYSSIWCKYKIIGFLWGFVKCLWCIGPSSFSLLLCWPFLSPLKEDFFFFFQKTKLSGMLPNSICEAIIIHIPQLEKHITWKLQINNFHELRCKVINKTRLLIVYAFGSGIFASFTYISEWLCQYPHNNLLRFSPEDIELINLRTDIWTLLNAPVYKILLEENEEQKASQWQFIEMGPGGDIKGAGLVAYLKPYELHFHKFWILFFWKNINH